MAPYDVTVQFHHNSGLVEHDCINVLHFEVNAPDTLAGLCTDIHASYTPWADTYLHEDYPNVTYKVYEPGLNPGGPVYTVKSGISVGIGRSPQEVALCLSYASVDNPEASTPRRRGRIYLGPLASIGGDRPDLAIRTAALQLGSSLAGAGSAGNTTWLLKSTADVPDSYHKIESIWVDDTWDTQRRRGLSPTLRQTADVQ